MPRTKKKFYTIKFYTIRQVASAVKLTPQQIRNYADDGRLKTFEDPISGWRAVKPVELKRFVTWHKSNKRAWKSAR